MEATYQWLFIIFAALFMFLMLIFAWERMDYELMKIKIRNMYKQLKKLVKDFKDEDIEAEELITRGMPDNKKSQSEDCDKSDKT